VAAAAAAVRENREAAHVRRQAEVTIEGDVREIEPNRPRSDAFGRRTHATSETNGACKNDASFGNTTRVGCQPQ
jgi:hypothetical protein